MRTSRGLWIYYALAEPGSPFHAKLVECLACCFREVPELEADLTAARQLAKQGGCCPLHEAGARPANSRSSRKSAARRGSECCK